MNRDSPASVAVDHVSKVYGGKRETPVTGLYDVSVKIAPGEIVSIEGPSGCGKTTLLNLLGLIDVPSSGRVQWNGEDVARLPERERARRRLRGVGFIFQRFYLIPTLTAFENVEMPMRALRLPRTERRARADELLQLTGLGHRRDAFPHQLSGGEEQRVAIARALANRPGLLLADEPTGELDSANATGVLDLIEKAHASLGATVVLVTHNPTVAARARRHLTMQDGRIVSDSRGA
jgi:putative ABC transport system ATP-binding protein